MAFPDKLCVNTHSSIRIQTEKAVVYLDPFRLETAPHDADVVFFTHEHFDHFSPEDVKKVLNEDTVFVMPVGMEKAAAKVVQAHCVLSVAPGGSGSVKGLDFEAVAAYNPKKRFHPKKQGWVGYVLTVDGQRVYVAGDTDVTPEAEAVRCDVALLPIGGTYTMNAAEAAALANKLRPELVIPIHYGSVAGDPEDFSAFAAAVDPAIRVCRVI